MGGSRSGVNCHQRGQGILAQGRYPQVERESLQAGIAPLQSVNCSFGQGKGLGYSPPGRSKGPVPGRVAPKRPDIRFAGNRRWRANTAKSAAVAAVVRGRDTGGIGKQTVIVATRIDKFRVLFVIRGLVRDGPHIIGPGIEESIIRGIDPFLVLINFNPFASGNKCPQDRRGGNNIIFNDITAAVRVDRPVILN